MNADEAALNFWREAHREAVQAYELWRLSHERDDYVTYRAAQDLEDAAQDELAGLAAS